MLHLATFWICKMRKDYKQLVEYAIKQKKKRENKEQKLADFILKRLSLF